MNDADRALLAGKWVEKGLGEHASVASFARFVLQLMSLAAPPAILLASIRAMDDEVRHAQLCFGIAAGLSGRDVGPGPLDLTGVLDAAEEPGQILRAAIIEGCVNETIAAGYASAAMSRTEEATIRRALERIAEDEQRHAELSWEFATWLLTKDPSLTETARTAFAEALRVDDTPSAPEPMVFERFGHLAPASRAEVRQDIVCNVIVPRATRLLSSRMSDTIEC